MILPLIARASLFVILATGLVSAGNIVTDFPASNLPTNGDWIYGAAATVGGAVTPFAAGFIDDSDYLGWALGDSTLVLRPKHTFTGGTVYYVTDFLNLHPGSGGMNAVVRWTAPSAGVYLIAGQFKSHDVIPSGVNAYVYIAGVNEYATLLTTTLQTAGFSISKSLAAGQTVDFIVNFAGTYINDSTGLQGSITSSAVPEPSSMLLMGTAAALLALVRRRR